MKLSSLAKLSEEFIVDILFPKLCIGCGKEGYFVCDNCSRSLELLSFQNCPICEKAMTVAGEQCSACKQTKQSPLDQMIVAGNYENELLSKAIHFYKYKFVEDLSCDLGAYAAQALEKWLPFVPDVIVPVPLHKKRLCWRGFNQSLLLAEYISKNLAPGIEIIVKDDLLTRKRNTSPQMEIKTKSARQQNVEGAFGIANTDEDLRGKKVLLVDDVCTTGATIFECAKELKKLRPSSVSAIVLARQR